MRLVALLASGLLLGACTATTVPTAERSPTPSTLNCRLPVTWEVPDTQATAYKAGFLWLPGGSLAEMGITPHGAASYDSTLSTWVPAPLTSTSPDGRRYAYGEGNPYQPTEGKLHLVDIASGSDTVIYRSTGIVYRVVLFAIDGIWLTAATPEGYSRGLWFEVRAGGTPRLISQTSSRP